jgi:hypothetical protein
MKSPKHLKKMKVCSSITCSMYAETQIGPKWKGDELM